MEQDVFCEISSVIFPFKNKWKKQGWTVVKLASVNEAILEDAIIKVYSKVAPKNTSTR